MMIKILPVWPTVSMSGSTKVWLKDNCTKRTNLMKKIIYLIPLLLLFPFGADAAFNTFTTSGGGQITLPSNGKTYTIQPSTRLESFTVGTSQITFEMSGGSIVELKSADRSNFVVSSGGPCEVKTTCENAQSTLLIHCASNDTTVQSITVTIDGTCTGSTSGSGGSSGGAAAGGGGAKQTSPPTAPPPPPPAPVSKPIALAPSPAPAPIAVAPVAQKIVGTLNTASKGVEVKKLEEKLMALGYLPKTAKADGVYDTDLVNAVKKLQKAHKLAQVGIVGPATLKLLNSGNVKSVASGPTPTPPPAAPTSVQSFTKNLSIGSSGDEVKLLQERLQDLGFFPASIDPNGYFGPTTAAALKKFQSANGVAPVGYVGPNTRKVLNK